MGSAINLSLPEIGKTFSMGAVSQSWIATIYLITTAIFQVPFARLADLFGRKKIFIAGLILFGISTFMCGLSVSGTMLIIVRALSGLACAMMFGTSMAILVSFFPPQQRGKAIGVNTAVVYFALASSGPFFGGILTHHFGWQSLFYLVGFWGIVVAIYAVVILKHEWTEAAGEHFDYTGSVIYALGLFGLIFGFSDLPNTMGLVFIATGIICFIAFIFYELKVNTHCSGVRTVHCVVLRRAVIRQVKSINACNFGDDYYCRRIGKFDFRYAKHSFVFYYFAFISVGGWIRFFFIPQFNCNNEFD
jgi:MFS family permease